VVEPVVASLIPALWTLAAPTITFSGGNDRALAEFLDRQSHQPIAFLADAERRWPKVTIPSNLSPKDRAEILLQRLGAQKTFDSTFVFGVRAWPCFFHIVSFRPSYLREFGAVRAEIVNKEDRIAAESQGAGNNLEELVPITLKKPIHWHWYFNEAHLVVKLPEMSESDYAKALAKALGAKVVDRGRDLYLDLDIPEYRRRSLASYEAMPSLLPSPGIKAECDFAQAVIGNIQDDILGKAMATRGGQVAWTTPYPAVVEASNRRISHLFSEEELKALGKQFDLTRTEIIVKPNGFYRSRFWGPGKPPSELVL
jgi:hypothetical protein